MGSNVLLARTSNMGYSSWMARIIFMGYTMTVARTVPMVAISLWLNVFLKPLFWPNDMRVSW